MSEYSDIDRQLIEEMPRRQELLRRESGRLEVIVWWLKKTGLCLVSLSENDQTLEFAVEPDHLIDAFNHPYFYAAQAGMQFNNPDNERNDT